MWWLNMASGLALATSREVSVPQHAEQSSNTTFPVRNTGLGANSLARTPPMGWMSWEVFRCDTDCAKHPTSCIDHHLYEQMTDRINADGYLEAGYNQVSIDDCWENHAGRDEEGRLSPDPSRFPQGMKALGDYMHSKGVQFGIYSDEGTETCGGFPGSKGFEKSDADTFASWGVDYLKLDGCFNNKSGFATGYPAMGAALKASGRNITYSCSWPAYLGSNESAKPFSDMIAAGCNLWRNWNDIQCNWASLSSIIDHWGDYGAVLQTWAGPGHWHDMDMLLIGAKCITQAEERTQMAIWSICASPLIMGNDLRSVPPESKQILLNKDAISVSQDSLGKMGRRHKDFSSSSLTQVWYRHLSNGNVAVALYNKGEIAADITLQLSAVGFSQKVSVYDIWEGKTLGIFEETFTGRAIPKHGTAFLRLAESTELLVV
eukprot:TRINITY_DN76789_c0_g1_i1.p1 TRINITY_DN76789_c0_g1~~TRINITY_DN76789_c0_g1_i1.p1  ORF type:complete len:432 (-),score=70.60 TRINITY_DN76789_c0_g1_i1:22-1317(-)